MAYNLFATDKQKNYPGTQPQQPMPQPDFQSDKAANYPSAMGAETTVDAPQLMPQTAAQGAGVAGGQPANVQQTVVRQTSAQKKIPSIDANDPASGMDAISQMYTSPEQEEKLRRASLNNQRIMAVADALRNIGNIYHTTKYAPAQQFNSPVQEEQARYEKGKAVRDAANMKYYTYQQAKAAQDTKQRQWEADYELRMADAARKAGYTEAQIKNMQDRLAQQKAYQDANLALGQRRADDSKAYNDARLKQQAKYQNTMAGIAARNASTNERRATAYEKKLNGGGSGISGVAPLDTPKGQINPNSRNYSNQLLQMFDYAKQQGFVQESDVSKRLRELGFGKDQSDNVKRQMVMDLLRTNPSIGDYAANRLGWRYGNGADASTPSIGWDDDEDENDDLEIGW